MSVALGFESEEALINTALSSPSFLVGLGFKGWQPWQAREVDGLFGVPDLILAFSKTDRNGRRVIRTCAFEFKRANWKRALAQAFKYSAFAHFSYVLLDFAHSAPALRSILQFTTANIGLVTIDGCGQLLWHYRPAFRLPYSLPLCKSVELMASTPVFSEYSRNSPMPACAAGLAGRTGPGRCDSASLAHS
jgi:hypothetical protein